MAREGTRSSTGNSRPRIFPVVETKPAIMRKRGSTAKTKGTTKGKKIAKAPGVVKKKAPAKEKEEGGGGSGVAAKLESAAAKLENGLEDIVKKVEKKLKPKSAKK